MYIETETLIDGMMASLRNDVLPAVDSARARARVWAIIDVLNNLRDRVELKCLFAQAEAESAEDALRACAAALKGPRPHEAARVSHALRQAQASGASPHERAVALRAAVVEALGCLARGVEPELAQSARAPLEAHVASQALRDVMVLKPSLLSEISKG